DADAGNQRIAEPRRFPVKLYVAYDAQAYYTSNVNLVPSGASEDYAVVIANTLALRGEFRSWAVGDGLLTPSVGFNFQRVYHGVGSDDHKALDFDAYSVPLSLRYRFGNNWEASAGFTSTAIYSLEGPPKYHLIFRSYSPSLNLRKLIGLGESHLLGLGAGVSYAATTSDRDSASLGAPFASNPFREDRNDKWDFSADAAYYYLHGKWIVSPYARLTYSDYLHYQESGATVLAPAVPPDATQVDRRDLTGSLGLSVSYNFTPWASARVFTSFDWRDSLGDDAFDYGYENTNAGVGLTLSASF
ncbi:MAG TPA: hypothetical protein VIO38_11645, partial [Rariglobus sp.]